MKKIIFTAFAMTASVPALAAGYGTAGCGLGSIAFGSKPGFIQVIAATLNGTSGNQTFGISTGSSNCTDAPAAKDPAKAKKKAEQKVFLYYNLAQIKADAARGEGNYIEGLAGLFGCQSQLTGNYSEFANLNQKNHGKIFNSNDADVVYSNLTTVMASENLSCGQG
jgi:hypothetical protein